MLWVAVFSVVFLKRKLELFHWVSLGVVMAGVAVVGLSSLSAVPGDESDLVAKSDPDVSPLVGILFVLGAQIFTATQFVVEEQIMTTHSVDPLAGMSFSNFHRCYLDSHQAVLEYVQPS